MIKNQTSIEIDKIIKHAQKLYRIKFKILCGKEGLKNKVKKIELNRPGMPLAGYFKNFAYNRLQVFGKGETSYINELSEKKFKKIIMKFFSYDIPACFFSHNLKPVHKNFYTVSNQRKIPVFTSSLSTGNLIKILEETLDYFLAPRQILHGVMVEVFGIGILILGKSGVGKSECALELISKGHRLIADDVVIIKREPGNTLIASGAELVKYHMEIRGIGIIDIKSLFGVGSVRGQKRVDIIVQLEEWNPKKSYERVGITENLYEVLGIKLPSLIIPVKPGRNIPVIIETIAKNKRAQEMGYKASQILERKLVREMRKKNGK